MSAGWWVAMKSAPYQMDHGDGGLLSWKSDISPVFTIASALWNENSELKREREKFQKSIEKNPDILSRTVKKVAKYFGADLVGIAQFDIRWVYSHRILNPRYHLGEEFSEDPLDLPEGIKYCIVIGIEEDYYMQETADGGVSMGDVGFGYSKMAIIAGSLAEFLRALGFTAIPSGNDLAISIPYAISAGLGEFSRMGLLITRKYGPRVRLAKVFTNAPLVPDRPIKFGVYEFCLKCKKCAEKCPSQAIPYGDPEWEGDTQSNIKGVYKWYVNVEKCFEYWCRSGNSACGVCVRVCPYNKPVDKASYYIHAFFREYIAPIVGGEIGKKLDDVMGYGKRKSSSSWWGFDYREIVSKTKED
jgi:reductive dehalogenase